MRPQGIEAVRASYIEAVQHHRYHSLSDSRGLVVRSRSLRSRVCRWGDNVVRVDGVGKGKYTVGLGQTNLAFCDGTYSRTHAQAQYSRTPNQPSNQSIVCWIDGMVRVDREDINSLSLSVVHKLLERYSVSPRDVGRLEVGTETIVDKSKAVKTTLMRLFDEQPDIEGIDTTNACYGGTAALINAVNWVESSSWDGRKAIVVAGDIAVYEPGPARPTGGAGVVALLIGPDAPLPLERGLRSTHMEDAYDFYKPNLESEYPVVDGKLSNSLYLRALDSCYRQFSRRFHAQRSGAAAAPTGAPFDVRRNARYVLFHSPYTKLVARSFGRLLYNDAMMRASGTDELDAPLEQFRSLSASDSYVSKELVSTLDRISAADFERQVEPSLTLARNLGNSYCGSLYACLVSAVAALDPVADRDQRMLMFSYGSGLASTMFSLQMRTAAPAFPLMRQAATEAIQRLDKRVLATPEQFSEAMLLRERSHSAAAYTPVGAEPHAPLFPGAYSLTRIDELKRREYRRNDSS